MLERDTKALCASTGGNTTGVEDLEVGGCILRNSRSRHHGLIGADARREKSAAVDKVLEGPAHMSGRTGGWALERCAGEGQCGRSSWRPPRN